MNREKAEWYKNRILWKAKQHKLLEGSQSCFAGDKLTEIQKKAIDDAVPNLEVVLFFWSGPHRWTALCMEVICSNYGGTLITAELDEIKKGVVLDQTNSPSAQDAKANSECIYLSHLDKKIWAPAGSNLFSLMNILKMFPLGGK